MCFDLALILLNKNTNNIVLCLQCVNCWVWCVLLHKVGMSCSLPASRISQWRRETVLCWQRVCMCIGTRLIRLELERYLIAYSRNWCRRCARWWWTRLSSAACERSSSSILVRCHILDKILVFLFYKLCCLVWLFIPLTKLCPKV